MRSAEGERATEPLAGALRYAPSDRTALLDLTNHDLSQAERLAEALGKKVEVVDNLADHAGNALGVVTDARSGKALISTGKEGYGATRNLIAGGMTESLGKSGQYEAFRDAVLKSIPEDELATSVNKYKGIYGNNPALIEREVVNEWVGNNLYNSSAIKQIVSADPQLATGVRNYFSELGAKLNGVDELKAVKQEVAQAEGMWERYTRFLDKNSREVISTEHKFDITIDDIYTEEGRLVIDKQTIKDIIKTEKYIRPDPKSYIPQDIILNHLQKFKGGVAKIYPSVPKGKIGPECGTFVMPKNVADELIKSSGGSISTLERILGMKPGELGSNPVRIDIPNPSGLRMPSGNEIGANENWIPGGFTSGKIPEAIIDQVQPGEYNVTYIYNIK